MNEDDESLTEEEICTCHEVEALCQLINNETGDLGSGFDAETAQRYYLASQGISQHHLNAVISMVISHRDHMVQKALDENGMDLGATMEAYKEGEVYMPLMAFLMGHRMGKQQVIDNV